eukprot:43218-Prymnesium_polylepis.1
MPASQRCASQRGNDGIVMPIVHTHFGAASTFVRTFCTLVVDPHAVQLGFVLSTEAEEREWCSLVGVLLTNFSASSVPCLLNWTTISWDTLLQRVDGAVASPAMCTNATLCKKAKYGIQSVKKYYGMVHWAYDRSLVLDAEARILKRMSIQRLFDAFDAAPSYWYSRHMLQTYQHISTQTQTAFKLTGRGVAGLKAFGAMGTPWASYMIDVQHWFYRLSWLRELLSHLKAVHGASSAAEAICETRGCSMEAHISFAYLFNRSQTRHSCYRGRFFEMNKELVRANLSELVSEGTIWGSGETLLRLYGPELEERTLHFIDDPRRPIFVYREQVERPQDLAAAARLVCRSRSLVISVCKDLRRPFFCNDGVVVDGEPPLDAARRAVLSTSSSAPSPRAHPAGSATDGTVSTRSWRHVVVLTVPVADGYARTCRERDRRRNPRAMLARFDAR